MTRGRLILAHVVIGVLVIGATRDVIAHDEHWPFSHYAMFSNIARSWQFEALRLYAVPADGGPEFPLRDYAALQPLDQCRISTALSWMEDKPDGAHRLDSAAEHIYHRYEQLRKDGRQAGPPISAVRIYRLGWQLAPGVARPDAPDRRTFVTEYHVSGAAP